MLSGRLRRFTRRIEPRVTTTVPEVLALPDAAAVARHGARLVAQQVAEAAVMRPANVVLAGGHTPERLYDELALLRAVPWERVHLFFGDERCVPPDDPASNYRMVRAHLTSRVAIPTANVHRVRTEAAPPALAAIAYEEKLRRQLQRGGLDLALLGVGPDGHTASLFPGHPALDERERWVVAVEAETAVPRWRVTLTLPVLTLAETVIFVVTGAEKAGVVAAILDDPTAAARYPAARVHGRTSTIWLADRAALGRRA
jgi:6-phosphogluconolactonase